MKLLLHACCGPCLIEPGRIFEEDSKVEELAIYYSNPNIHPQDEYERRRDACRSYAVEKSWDFFEDAYDISTWEESLGEMLEAPERCRACYRVRFRSLAKKAKELGCEAISTTLSVSPYQDQEAIREELEDAAKAHGLLACYQDFSPNYREATRLSRELGMYRQNYCGCHYSNIEAQAQREARKKKRRKQEKT